MRPPAGVECVTCRDEKNHRCQAQIYDDGVALCLPCADGAPCVVDRIGRPQPVMEFSEGISGAEIPPAPVIHRTPEELGLSRVVAEAPRAVQVERLQAASEAAGRKEAAKLHAAVEARAKRGARRERLSVRVIGGGRLDVKITGGDAPQERPKRKLHFSSEELERKRTEMRERNLAKGKATRARVRPLLGMMPDPAVAEQVGVSTSRVAQLREEQGIPPVVVNNSHPGAKRTEEAVDEMREAVKKLGGTMTDDALGKQLGVSGSRIGQLRKELGIAAAKPGRKPASAKTSSKALIKRGQQTVTIEAGLRNGGVDALIGDGFVRVRLDRSYTLEQARMMLARLTADQAAVALEAVWAKLLEG